MNNFRSDNEIYHFLLGDLLGMPEESHPKLMIRIRLLIDKLGSALKKEGYAGPISALVNGVFINSVQAAANYYIAPQLIPSNYQGNRQQLMNEALAKLPATKVSEINLRNLIFGYIHYHVRDERFETILRALLNDQNVLRFRVKDYEEKEIRKKDKNYEEAKNILIPKGYSLDSILFDLAATPTDTARLEIFDEVIKGRLRIVTRQETKGYQLPRYKEMLNAVSNELSSCLNPPLEKLLKYIRILDYDYFSESKNNNGMIWLFGVYFKHVQLQFEKECDRVNEKIRKGEPPRNARESSFYYLFNAFTPTTSKRNEQDVRHVKNSPIYRLMTQRIIVVDEAISTFHTWTRSIFRSLLFNSPGALDLKAVNLNREKVIEILRLRLPPYPLDYLFDEHPFLE